MEIAGTSRGTSWTDKEIKALINIWGEDNIQEELDGAVRNSVIYSSISKKMYDMGFVRDWKQCRTKIKNLKKEYRQVKDHNGETGRGRKTCKFYTELDSILGHRPASTPAVLIDTGSACDDEESETNGNWMNSCSYYNYLHKNMLNRWRHWPSNYTSRQCTCPRSQRQCQGQVHCPGTQRQCQWSNIRGHKQCWLSK